MHHRDGQLGVWEPLVQAFERGRSHGGGQYLGGGVFRCHQRCQAPVRVRSRAALRGDVGKSSHGSSSASATPPPRSPHPRRTDSARGDASGLCARGACDRMEAGGRGCRRCGGARASEAASDHDVSAVPRTDDAERRGPCEDERAAREPPAALPRSAARPPPGRWEDDRAVREDSEASARPRAGGAARRDGIRGCCHGG